MSLNKKGKKYSKEGDEKNISENYKITYEDYLFPQLSDPNFSYKVGKRREFYENSYTDYIEGEITERVFIEKSDILCNLPFNISPHQRFVRNFMSFNTPYNSLLLYHGLGTGKTCSAMGICEEMRDYMKKIGSTQRIIIIASPNVQYNFKNQLFDKDKLKKTNGKWNIESCVGTTIINEVLQHVSHTLKKEVLTRSIQRLIKKYYLFIGYQEFSNYFNKKILKSLEHIDISDEQKTQVVNKRIQTLFGNRLIVIDEAHNLRPSNKKEKGIGNVLTQIVENTKDLRLLLLSATPMYNTPQEIVWMVNLMCKNDKLPTLDMSEIFDGRGNLRKIEDDDGNIIEIGAQKLSQKLNGHISFVIGDNPFTFPFSLYPGDFEPEKSVKSLNPYPEKMMNGTDIIQQLEYLDCYMTDAGDRQKEVYVKILDELVKNLTGVDNERKLEDMEGFGYSFIQPLLDALIICFPQIGGVSSFADDKQDVSPTDTDLNTYMRFTGKSGLEGVMNFNKKSGYNTEYTYKKETTDTYGRIFSKTNVGKYSGKIKSILDAIENSDGIVMIYSQFLDGSLIPLALSLEEDGYERTDVSGATNLLSDREIKNIKKQEGYKNKGKYAFISGNSGYSPNNSKELAKIVEDENKDGQNIKVVIISRAGSEGLDFKNTRQLHILEPWYNTKRIEQIIGRAARNCSHKTLPFEKRNVSIYLHATNPFIKTNDELEEPVDLYVYRYAERGAVKIGVITRLLKETAIDCLLNNSNMDFSADKLNLRVKIKASNKKHIEYVVGNKPYTSVCDYMEKCSYVCKKGNSEQYSVAELKTIDSLLEKTNQPEIDTEMLKDELLEPSFYENDISTLIGKISSLYLEDYAFSFDDIHRRLKGYAGKQYSHVQLIAALNSMIENKHIKVIDNFGRYGNLVKAGDMYFFNPVETLQLPNDYFEIKTPVEFKHEKLLFLQPIKRKEAVILEKRRTKSTDTEVHDIYKKYNLYENQIDKYLNDIQDKMDIAFDNPEIGKNEKNWYRVCNVVVPEIMKVENVSVSIIEKCIIHHIIDFDTDFTMKRTLIEYGVGSKLIENDDAKLKKQIEEYKKSLDEKKRRILSIVDNYINNAIVVKHIDEPEKMLVCMFDDNYIFNYYVFKINEDGFVKLELAKPEDINEFKSTIIAFQKSKIEMMSDYVGFASVFKDNRITFKVKYMKQARSKGARCDQSGKSKSIALINEFRDETIDGVYNKKEATKVLENMITIPICIYQELLLRSYNERRINDKLWFLPIEHYKQTNIESVTL
jgi:hypothetical protein